MSDQDWTGYTGTATFKRKPQDEQEILTLDVTADAAGGIQIGGTSADADLFPAIPRLGTFMRAVCEVSMTNGTDVQKFQIRVAVGGRI